MDKLGTGTALKTASPPQVANPFRIRIHFYPQNYIDEQEGARYYDEQRRIDSLKSGFYIDDEKLKEVYEDMSVLGAFQSGETIGEADEE